jgi:hypothetical protein
MFEACCGCSGVQIKTRKRNIAVALDPGSFANAVVDCLEDAKEGNDLEKNLQAGVKVGSHQTSGTHPTHASVKEPRRPVLLDREQTIACHRQDTGPRRIDFWTQWQELLESSLPYKHDLRSKTSRTGRAKSARNCKEATLHSPLYGGGRLHDCGSLRGNYPLHLVYPILFDVRRPLRQSLEGNLTMYD